MKYLTWILGITVSILVFIYIIVFTSLGNSLLKPTIEKNIQEQTKFDSKLEVFSLNMNEFEILLSINNENTVHLKGTYSLFSQAFDIVYNVKLKNLNSLKELSSTQLNGSLYTDGTIKGDMKFLVIDGKSDIAKSDTNYHIELSELNPTSVIAKINDASLESLLYLVGQKQYASAILNLDINFKSIKPHELDGEIVLRTDNGKINPALMLSDFNVSIPKTSFVMNLDANLKDDDVEYKYKLTSNLFKILSSGKLVPEPLKTDINYSLNIKKLELLKPITGADIRGSLNLAGTAEGTKEKLIVNAKSDLASSNTNISLILKDFKPSSTVATVKNLKLKKLLYMLNQPHYTDGLFSLEADISDLREGNLKGGITTNLKNGLLDSAYISKAYEFKSKMPRTTFNSKTVTRLDKNMVDTKVDFNSNIANLDIKSAKFNIKESSLASDYVLKVNNLDKLFFVTGQHLKGSIFLNGEVKKAEDLDVSAHTKIAKGKIDAFVHNDDFKADLKDIQTLDLLHMLIYPEVFKSTLNAKLDYNLAKSKGKISGHLVDGIFTRNQIFNLIKKYAKFDMYREKFNGNIYADIDKENILTSLDLKSRKASIKTKDTSLNTKTQMIDSKVKIIANNNPIGAEIKGNINRPKVKVDVEDLLKKELNKAAEKGVKKLFKKFF